MYENFNYDYFMQSMLANVPDDLDKREGSIIWDALAPVALELETVYLFLGWVLAQSFADSADREYLIMRAHERGLIPNPATCAVLKAEFTPSTLSIPAGTQFNLNELNYKVGDAITGEPGSYQLICETAGTIGHKYLGTLTPIDYVEGLETASATEVLIPGEDEEDTEDFRARYLDNFTPIRFGGNIAQYLDWVNAIDGVGGARVARRVSGERKVIVTIINAEYGKATSTLVEAVQESLDPNEDGDGTGIAPIGHEISVVAAEELTVNVYIDVDFDTGYSWSNMSQAITDAISEYLLELRTNWKNYSSGVNTVVRISQIETKILALTGVIDVSGTEINGVASNLTITDNKIPVMGVVTHG